MISRVVHVQCVNVSCIVCDRLATKVYTIENVSYKMNVGDHIINKLTILRH